MRPARFAAWTFSVSMTLGAGVVCGQDYPSKPVRFYASEIGGSTDFAIRLIAPGVSGGLGQSVVVENRPSNLLGEFIAKQPPDGYTVLIAGGTFLTLTLTQKMSYDPVRDFAPVTIMTRSPDVVIVHPALPVKSVKELIALAKARPGELNYGAGPAGGGPYLAAESFKAMAGINIVYIPYKGAGPALNALLAGEIQLMLFTPAPVMPLIRSGKLKALAVASPQPSALFPGLPTVTASGLPGYESATITGVYAPAKTSAAVINRLNQEIVRVLNRADVKEKFLNTATEVVASPPEELASYIQTVMTRVSKLLKNAGIKPE